MLVSRIRFPLLLSAFMAAACAGPADPPLLDAEDDVAGPGGSADENRPMPPTGEGGAAPTDDEGEGGGAPGGGGPSLDGPPDATARLLYINQRVYREDDAFARGGTAVLEVHAPQALPVDDRPEFFNGDGERCTLEVGTEWPTSLAGGATWPAGPFLDAGDLRLAVSGSPGLVVYEYYDSYYLRAAPAPVQLGNFIHSYFYPPVFIPHGADAALEAAGGTDLGAFEVSGLELAPDYTVTSPNLVVGNDTIDTGSALTFTWGPPSPGDDMVVIVKDSFSYLKCVFDDDGEATVPASAMGNLVGGAFATITIQTWREHHDERRVLSADGQRVDVAFTSRHVQIGRFGSM
ncbi:MAG: hypothetical protein AAF715_25005 [Myxococcota bacterium]